VALTLATHGTDQFLVQRLLSARSEREASVGLVLSGLIVFAQFALFLVIGIALFAYYQHVPVPALGRADEILPAFIVHSLTGGVAGFIVAAIVAAALSPSLNAMAAVTVRDFYVPFVIPPRPMPTCASRGRPSPGASQIGVAVAAQWMDRSSRCRARGAAARERPGAGAFLVGVFRDVGAGAMLKAAGITGWWRSGGRVPWPGRVRVHWGDGDIGCRAGSLACRKSFSRRSMDLHGTPR
jgi:hypothetical protein